MRLLKNPRIWIWIFFVVVSIIIIGPNLNPDGYKINHIEKSIGVEGIEKLHVDDIILSINDNKNIQEAILEKYSGIINVDTNDGIILLRANNTELGIGVEKVSTSNINLGLDLKGGVRAVIEPIINDSEENITVDSEAMNRIITTLQTRINVFGLREANFRPMLAGEDAFIEVTLAGGTRQELTDLLEKQGKFEAKVPIILRDELVLELTETHIIPVEGNKIIINGEKYGKGETFELDDIPFTIDGVSVDAINLTSIVFTGEDISTVYLDPQRSRMQQVSNGYEWAFSVLLSPKGADKFAMITNNLDQTVNGYLNAPLMLYLDDKELDRLNIVNSLKGQIVREPSITGGADTLEEAAEERLRLQSILKSGSLPVAIEIAQLDVISPTLGESFLQNAAFAGLGAILIVALVTFIRYKRPKLVIPLVLTSLSELVIILGMATMIGWTVDLAAIAGIIAAVGTGIDSIIMITDETILGKREEISFTERMKRAFFIVFGAGGTTIAAMLPLTILGFGILRGFAIVTMIGVLAGIFITRPAYGEIIKYLYK
ncbi:hypothetical protein CL614_06270 [archaeon]|nr:hypothetical protein [archaeon]|tara:strand:+ start:1171 stop:2808 length:1638 start_codon:yes stop_codon:yes gene_type:complete